MRAPHQAAPFFLADVLLNDLSALGGAACDVGGFGKALALAGILALASGRTHLAGALPLAGIDTTAFDAGGMGRRGERAGGEDRGGRREDCTLCHVSVSLDDGAQRAHDRCGRIGLPPVYAACRAPD